MTEWLRLCTGTCVDNMNFNGMTENVEDNEKCKLLWDFSIQTERKLDHNRLEYANRI